MWWLTIAWAEEVPNETEQTIQIDDLAIEHLQHQALQEKVQALQQELIMQSDFSEQDTEIVEQLSVLIDTRQSIQARQQAIEGLAKLQTTQALPFFYAVLGDNAQLTAKILAVLPAMIGDSPTEKTMSEIGGIFEQVLYTTTMKPANITVAIGGSPLLGSLEGEPVIVESVSAETLESMRGIKHPQLAELLMRFITDETVPVSLREQALRQLQMDYSTWLADKEIPVITAPNNRLANQLYAVSSGVTGSVLLGSVGVWGQNETSEVIGYTGGALLGATSGWLISQQQHPTLAQATLMASSNGWGLAMGQMLADGWDLQSEYAALSRTLGVVAGTGYGHWARDRNMSLSDVLEADFAGYFGAQMAVALTDISVDQSLYQYPEREDYYGYGQVDWEDPAVQAADEAYWQARDEYFDKQEALYNRKLLTATLGATVGLGASHLLMDTWKPKPESVLFAGVWSGQLGIATDGLLPVIGTEYPQGWVRLASHTAMAGALYYDHRHPVSYEQSIFSAYGAGVGYLLGYGVNDLAKGRYPYGVRNAAVLSTLGALGGTSIGNSMNFSNADWVTTGVGLGLSLWHMTSIDSIARDYKWLNLQQSDGLFQTGMGVAALGLLATGKQFDVSSSDAIFLGSTAGWGAYYGALTPIMLGIDEQMTGTEQLLTTLIASDLVLASGAYGLLTDRFTSESTAMPQVLGLAGATLGSLGAFLFTDSSQVVSGAALLGATAGIASGVLLEQQNKGVSLHLEGHNRYTKRLSGLRLQPSPYVDEDGNMGVYLGISN